MPSLAAPQRVEIGLHAGDDAPRAQLCGLIRGHHLQVFEAVPASGHGNDPEVCDDAFEGVDRRRDRGIADDVEAGGHAAPRCRPARALRRRRGRGGRCRCCPARRRTAGAARRCASPARRRRTGHRPARGRRSPSISARACAAVVTGLTPVADHLDAVLEGTQLQPVVEAADLGPGAFVHRDDARRGERRPVPRPGFGQLLAGQQATGGGPDQMVGVAGQRPLGGRNPPAAASSGTSRRSPVDASAECTSTRAR